MHCTIFLCTFCTLLIITIIIMFTKRHLCCRRIKVFVVNSIFYADQAQKNTNRRAGPAPVPDTVRPGCPSGRRAPPADRATFPTWCSAAVRWWWVCWTTSRPRPRQRSASCTARMRTAASERPSSCGSHRTGRSNPCQSIATITINTGSLYGKGKVRLQ